MKNEQDSLEKLLEEELRKEADQILAELEADESLKNIELPGDLDTRMMERIRKIEEEKEVYSRLSEEDREALRIGREMQILREMEDMEKDDENAAAHAIAENANAAESGTGAGTKTGTGNVAGRRFVVFRKKIRKAYLLAAAVALVFIGMGVTTVGEGPMYTEVGKVTVGNRELVQIDSVREGELNVQTGSDEIEAYEKIKEEFGSDVVKLQYKPNGTTFLDIDIDMILKHVYVFYQYENSIIEYQVMFNYLEQSAGYDIEDNLVKEENVSVSDVPVNLKTYNIEEENRKVMVAKFEYKGVYYILRGGLEEKEFIKIIKNLNFF